jgi:peptide/nickel transport system ATP-binding protein
MVITKGQIVERGPVSTVMHEPSHPYTKLLLDSIPQPDPDLRWTSRIAVDELDQVEDNTPADTTKPEAPII